MTWATSSVVLGVENVVDGGQADVLVGATVTRDIVGVKQFVVVGVGVEVVLAGNVIGIRCAHDARGIARVGNMRDVVEEGVAGADSAAGADGRAQVGR